jgi:hypothetical protein
MTPKEETQKDERTIQNLEEICENTRAIRRVVNRILDHLHDYNQKGIDENAVDYDPDAFSWQDFSNNDDVYM